mmetsp:Transcript_44966/g.106896  ORF Transcript_44966/g.106896 Transcript_44966/m.106896 type:complete len:453 (-) Transcript_44966:83-1441(-)
MKLARRFLHIVRAQDRCEFLHGSLVGGRCLGGVRCHLRQHLRCCSPGSWCRRRRCRRGSRRRTRGSGCKGLTCTPGVALAGLVHHETPGTGSIVVRVAAVAVARLALVGPGLEASAGLRGLPSILDQRGQILPIRLESGLVDVAIARHILVVVVHELSLCPLLHHGGEAVETLGGSTGRLVHARQSCGGLCQHGLRGSGLSCDTWLHASRCRCTCRHSRHSRHPRHARHVESPSLSERALSSHRHGIRHSGHWVWHACHGVWHTSHGILHAGHGVGHARHGVGDGGQWVVRPSKWVGQLGRRHGWHDQLRQGCCRWWERGRRRRAQCGEILGAELRDLREGRQRHGRLRGRKRRLGWGRRRWRRRRALGRRLGRRHHWSSQSHRSEPWHRARHCPRHPRRLPKGHRCCRCSLAVAVAPTAIHRTHGGAASPLDPSTIGEQQRCEQAQRPRLH